MRSLRCRCQRQAAGRCLLINTLVAIMAIYLSGPYPVHALGCPVTLTSSAVSGSLRIMVYNVAMQVAPGDSEAYFFFDFDERTKVIAKMIKDDDPDIVILNEVNRNRSKEVFQKALQDTYPSYISFLDGPWYNRLNDSGLMLFSKYQFAMPDKTSVTNNRLAFENQGVRGKVNLRLYSGVGADWWANKGVAMVRILHECDANSPFNIAFTHMQASSPTGFGLS